MSRPRFSVRGFDGLVHLIQGSLVRTSWWTLSIPEMKTIDKGELEVTSTVCRWVCTRDDAPAGMQRTDEPLTCLGCIAAEHEHDNT